MAVVTIAGLMSVPSVLRSAMANSGPCQPPRCIQGALTVGTEHVAFNVLLPVGYASSTARYPVVYMLHGGLGDQNNWLDSGHIDEFTTNLPPDQQAIVVMPAAPGIGGWIDWQNGNHAYETALVNMLVPFVDSHYRTIADRSHRAIAGLSAGGFGALHTAARHPDLFAAVASFSGLDDVTDPVVEAALIAAVPGVSAICVASPSNSVSACPDNAGIQDVLPPSGWGSPATDQWWFHNHNPGDHAVNFRGMSVWLASGNGIPCDPSEARNPSGAALEAVLIRRTHSELDNDFTAAGIARTSVYRPCGIHDWPYWRQDLAEWWPVMLSALGSSPPPAFDFRTIDPTFSVWGWNVSADPHRAREFLMLEGASASGVGLTGSGLTTVTTGPLFKPGQTVALLGATSSSAVADSSGRLTFQVDLGPPHSDDEYTVQAAAREALANSTSTGYFISRSVHFLPRSGRH